MSVRARSLPAGWYPSSAAECKSNIDEFLAGFTPPAGEWRGGVAPHAGWYFSGRAAARVICTLAAPAKPDRIVLYGGHLSGSSRPIIYPDDAWETPFGPIPVDADLAEQLASRGAATPAAKHFADNTVEIQLPFVKHFFPDVPILAIHAPASNAAVDLAAAVENLLQERALKAAWIGSADLTHYGPNYGFVPKGTGAQAVAWVKDENDRILIDKARALDVQGLLRDAQTRQNTCSAGPMAAVMASAIRAGIKQGRLLEYYTSFDIMPGASFVGYAGIVY
jgi:AmmeMemoRadiSam system protein B